MNNIPFPSLRSFVNFGRMHRLDPSKGLFRTTLAGQGRTLQDAFANLERTQRAERVHRVERAVHHPRRNMFGARVGVGDDDGRGYWDFMRAREDMYVIVENFSFQGPRMERIADDGMLQFYFALSGDLTLALPGAETLRLNQPSLLVYHQPRGLQFTASTAASARQRAVIVNVRPQFLLDTFVAEAQAVPAPLQALLDGRCAAAMPAAMPYSRLPLSPTMFELVTKLVDAPYDGVLGLLNTEAIVMELLCAGVARVGLQRGALPGEYSPREMRCLQRARDIVMREMAHPPTLREVARAAGLNETTLKQGFKATFGETLFDLSVRCRMQRALDLLRDGAASMTQVAQAVGYRHPTTFATAFRRHFGTQPKEVRRGMPASPIALPTRS